MRLRRSRASSSVMPAFRCTSIWPRPLPTLLGSPAFKSLGDSWRRAAFSRKTWSAAFARSSLADSMRMSWSWRSNSVWESLKSKRVLTSRRAWSNALVNSAGLNSETTSKENSATRVHDRVDAGIDRDSGQHDPDQRGDDEHRPDPGRALVERLQRRPVVWIGPVVDVVDAVCPRSLDELVEHRLAAWGKLPAGEVGDRLPEVVARAAELNHHHVEGLRRGRCRVLAAQVRDDAIEAHVRDCF